MEEQHSIMRIKRITTGSDILDTLLEGGLETDIITTVYGPAGSGKTNFCILAAISTAKRGKKVLFMDTEGGFSTERMKQIDPDYRNTINNITFIQPSNFTDQRKMIEKLSQAVTAETGLIIIDTISMLYRLEMGKILDVAGINCELSHQLSVLTEIARGKKIPVLLTNQVYADFQNRNRVKMVGGDILKYGSKGLIELIRTRDGTRRAVLRKHRSIPEDSEVRIKIVNSGITEAKE